MAPTIEETEKCYSFAEKHNIQLFCALNRRFDPAYRKIYNKVKGGEIGRLQLIVHNNRDHPEPKEAFLTTGTGKLTCGNCGQG